MTTRQKLIVAAVACLLHVLLLAPTRGQQSPVLVNDFGPEAAGIEAGALPYEDAELEYPPLSIPIIVGPALVTDTLDQYTEAFQLEMLAVDLAIVLLLALFLPGSPRHVIAALVVYTLGVVALSGLVLGGSDIDEAPLALGRFDLWPALLVLAAVLAREANRSATWSALLSTAVAVKAFPLVLFPPLLRDEKNLVRVLIAGLVPIFVAAAIVIGFGDEFASAITYHTDRPLQVESVPATLLEIGAINDPSKVAEYGSGSFNYVAGGADAARAVSLGIMVSLYVLVLWAGWRSRASHLKLATALLAVIVVFSPVLSPQFLFWLLPLSAAAFGLSFANVALVAACVLTQLMLQFYARMVVDFDPEFVWRLAGRNATLLVYVALVCAPIVRDALRESERPEAPAPAT